MSEHPLELSARLIDTGVIDARPNRITQELSELGDGVAIIESFSHVVAVDTGDGVVCFDSSGAQSGRAVVESLRGWSDDPIHTLVYCTATSITSGARGRSPPTPPTTIGRHHVCSVTNG